MRFLTVSPRSATQIEEPPIARFLFADTRIALLWLVVRLYVGYEWFTAGWDKLTGRSIAFDSFGQAAKGGPWVFAGHDGTALSGFVAGALKQAQGAHPAVQSWYASFLQNFVQPNAAVFSYIITFGELCVGLGLILGVLTGIAAFFGIFMNLNFMLAGAVSINPVIGTLAIFLVLAWRVAGYYGVDRYLLPLLGTPWTGSLEKQHRKEVVSETKPAVQ
jgi:thiosulfate dehydrogenase [quinone] large subunit